MTNRIESNFSVVRDLIDTINLLLKSNKISYDEASTSFLKILQSTLISGDYLLYKKSLEHILDSIFEKRNSYEINVIINLFDKMLNYISYNKYDWDKYQRTIRAFAQYAINLKYKNKQNNNINIYNINSNKIQFNNNIYNMFYEIINSSTMHLSFKYSEFQITNILLFISLSIFERSENKEIKKYDNYDYSEFTDFENKSFEIVIALINNNNVMSTLRKVIEFYETINNRYSSFEPYVLYWNKTNKFPWNVRWFAVFVYMVYVICNDQMTDLTFEDGFNIICYLLEQKTYKTGNYNKLIYCYIKEIFIAIKDDEFIQKILTLIDEYK